MKIILVGVACVGKSTVGKLLADSVGYKFIDFDAEVEKHFNRPITLIKNQFFSEHGFRAKAQVVLHRILHENSDNFVLTMPPGGLMDSYWRIIRADDSLTTIALKDSPENILKRLVFYDDYSRPMASPVTHENAWRYLREIKLDMRYFGRTHARAKFQKQIDGKGAAQVAEDLREMLGLQRLLRDNHFAEPDR
ncbi:MAG: AAA family ATPase [Selenomonadales bacterium]|nr:AAA family ATPase [Selenomonadales bacterium]